VEGSCEHGNEHSDSIKCWEVSVAAQLADSQEGLSSSSKEVSTSYVLYIKAGGKCRDNWTVNT
jgi:hypothetical protein